jgi:hypothetical protein
MKDLLIAKWPVSELSAIKLANGCSYLTAKQAADLYDVNYKTFIRQLKDFVQYGVYPGGAFRVNRRLNPNNAGNWRIEIEPVLGIRALNEHFFPRWYE